ncbi:MAG TPA: hypothetical protein VME40_14185, partial [Caulobacteraceae bacterium]|nr:hypothetical protein [Caulobacteraceae bacterium]
LVLPVEGGPLVYATRYAHDLVLRIKLANGHDVDVAARADAEKGGFVVDTSALTPATFGQGTEGVIHGQWGFTPFDGPQVSLRGDRAQGWTLSDEARRSLVVGRSDPLTLTGDAACVDKVAVSTPEGRMSDVAWRLSGPDKLSLTLPLTKTEPGGLSLSIWRYGAAAPQIVPLRAYAPASEIAAFAFAAGDQAGVLEGSRLDEVAELRLAGVAFKPSESQPTPGELTMLAVSPDAAAALAAGRTLTADIDLKDGRREQLAVKVSPPRPTVALIAKSVRRPLATDGLIIRLGDDRELAQDGVLAFSFRALRPAALAADVSVEVATADGRGSVTLTPKDGVTLEDARVGVVTLDLAKAFDSSVFGPLRFRLVEEGTASNWQSLGTLVRLPILKTLACRKARRAGCELAGDRLFLLESVSADAAFAQPAVVQPGFAGDTLVVPHPDAGRLYARLRDAPDIVNAVDIFEPGQDVALAGRTPPASTAGPN